MSLSFLLASASPRRREVCRSLGMRFRTVQHRFHEPSVDSRGFRPCRYVETVARGKALSVAPLHPDAVVIAADTIVVARGRILGKPRDTADARRILGILSGSVHRVYTGMCLAWERFGVQACSHEVSVVHARSLSEREIDALAHKHLDKAGAYAVQERQDRFVTRINGDYYNVVGFPVGLFLELMGRIAADALRRAAGRGRAAKSFPQYRRNT